MRIKCLIKAQSGELPPASDFIDGNVEQLRYEYEFGAKLAEVDSNYKQYFDCVFNCSDSECES